MPPLPEPDGGPLPGGDPHPGSGRTAPDIDVRARLDAAQSAPADFNRKRTRAAVRKEPSCVAYVHRRPIALIAHLGGREKALEAFGWNGRRGRVDRPSLSPWRRLHPRHSGRVSWVATRSRCGARSAPSSHRAWLSRRSRPASEGIGRVCRIRARKVYRALGAEDFFRRRRITSRDVLMRRLLALDYVLECPDLPWLPTETEKVAAFEALGIERRILPQRTYGGATGDIRRHYHLGLPLALDAERVVFVYVDPGHETAKALRAWGAAHRELWAMLRDRRRKIEVVAVGRTREETGRADAVLGNWARDPRPSEYDAEIEREMEWIEDVIRSGDESLLREVCGDIRGGLVRLVELQNRARRESGRGLLHRVSTWRTRRLARRLF